VESVKIIKACAILFLMTFYPFSNVFPQSNFILLKYPQGLVIDGLSGFGYNISTNSTISTFNNSNPANIYDFEKINIGLSYQYDTKIEKTFPASPGYSRAYPYLPQSFGVVFQISHFKFGLGINQIYNSEKDYGEVTGVIVWPDENGYKEVTLYPEERQIVFKNSLSLAFDFENLKKNMPGNLVFGIQYNYNFLNYILELNNSDISDTDIGIFASNFSIGIRYNFHQNEKPVVELGIYYETETEFDKVENIRDESTRYIGHIPAKLHLGFLFNCNPSLYISGNYSVLFWENIDREYSNKLNNSELSGTIGYQFNNNFNLSIGIFSNNYRFEDTDLSMNLNNMYADYFFCGFTYTISSFFSELVIADSHLLSDEWRKQTILKLGLGYEF
jgi:hypothetical protein